MITITSAPPFATVQDLGRHGYRDAGVPVSGVADADAARAVNAILGNDANAAMIEWAVGGGSLRFDSDATVVLGGAGVVCTMHGRRVDAMDPVSCSAGAELVIERIIGGRFLYIGVRGGIDVPIVLGSRSTLLSARMGGLEGRRLRDGDHLRAGDMIAGSIMPASVRSREPAPGVAKIRIVHGPMAHLFGDATWREFMDAEYTVSRVSDRTGYRLDGVALPNSGGAMPSEPMCVGAIQAPDGGAPIVIMHDGPTVGGYPPIGVIRRVDLSRFAQLTPGDRLRFVLE
jgi:biotin-dependent carboxylase-like uncharacterized protein